MFAGPVDAIGEAQLKMWLIEWDRSLKTKANYHGLIYGVFAYAVKRGWLAANPATGTGRTKTNLNVVSALTADQPENDPPHRSHGKRVSRRWAARHALAHCDQTAGTCQCCPAASNSFSGCRAAVIRRFNGPAAGRASRWFRGWPTSSSRQE